MEPKLKNKRFRQTEKTIMAAFLIKEKLSVGRLIKRAGISRSTFYRHHHTVYDVIPDYKKFILRKYRHTMKCLMLNKQVRLRTLYQRTLVFIYSYQEIFDLFLKCDTHGVVEAMLSVLKPKILSVSDITDGEMIRIYLKGVAGLIESWQQDGFQKDEIFTVLDKISYLTKSAHRHLKPVAK